MPASHIPIFSDLIGAAILYWVWSLLHQKHPKTAYWWVIGNLVLAGATSVPDLMAAVDHGEMLAVAYQALWVLVGLGALLHAVTLRSHPLPPPVQTSPRIRRVNGS